jgi:putative SOS response-associated peptidase YedK
MPADDCPEDDECRQTYNFPPGAFGLVYRANVPDYGAGPRKDEGKEHDQADDKAVGEIESSSQKSPGTHYKLQSMKWGLIPSWTKRNPDYGSMMKTINCRDDSLMENKGMWNVMKRRKRCIVMCQGFYEWLKKGKDKVPHFIKRKDGQLMCMAGLWDCVKYEGSNKTKLCLPLVRTDS